jgi:hypothetical protein
MGVPRQGNSIHARGSNEFSKKSVRVADSLRLRSRTAVRSFPCCASSPLERAYVGWPDLVMSTTRAFGTIHSKMALGLTTTGFPAFTRTTRTVRVLDVRSTCWRPSAGLARAARLCLRTIRLNARVVLGHATVVCNAWPALDTSPWAWPSRASGTRRPRAHVRCPDRCSRTAAHEKRLPYTLSARTRAGPRSASASPC